MKQANHFAGRSNVCGVCRVFVLFTIALLHYHERSLTRQDRKLARMNVVGRLLERQLIGPRLLRQWDYARANDSPGTLWSTALLSKAYSYSSRSSDTACTTSQYSGQGPCALVSSLLRDRYLSEPVPNIFRLMEDGPDGSCFEASVHC